MSISRFFGKFIARNADVYADVPVAKAAFPGNGGGGLKMSQQWGWNVQLEKWAQDEGKRKELFEWALNRAEMAAKVPPPEESVKGAIQGQK